MKSHRSRPFGITIIAFLLFLSGILDLAVVILGIFAIQAWHMRFGSPWAVVAGTTEIGEPMTFYSPDHPAPLTPGEVWSSGLTTLDEAKRLGFIGICDTTDNRLPECEAWMKENAPNAEQLVMTTRRFFKSHPGPSVAWKIFIQPPAK